MHPGGADGDRHEPVPVGQQHLTLDGALGQRAPPRGARRSRARSAGARSAGRRPGRGPCPIIARGRAPCIETDGRPTDRPDGPPWTVPHAARACTHRPAACSAGAVGVAVLGRSRTARSLERRPRRMCPRLGWRRCGLCQARAPVARARGPSRPASPGGAWCRRSILVASGSPPRAVGLQPGLLATASVHARPTRGRPAPVARPVLGPDEPVGTTALAARAPVDGVVVAVRVVERAEPDVLPVGLRGERQRRGAGAGDGRDVQRGGPDSVRSP